MFEIRSPLLQCLCAAWLVCPAAALGQSDACAEPSGTIGRWPVHQRVPQTTSTPAPGSAIVIGFVGGFVNPGDFKHPEVRFSAFLRERHPFTIRTQVFANREGEKALRQVLAWLAADADGTRKELESEAPIVIYGHSWGASQVVELARELGKQNIPVQLTIQVDSVRKPGRDDSTIPPNVKNAINFYQTRGLIRGRRAIRAADPGKTTILGNIRMTYERGQVDSGQCSWLARTFSGAHCQIENDSRIWDQMAWMVESTLAGALGQAPASSDTQRPDTTPICPVARAER